MAEAGQDYLQEVDVEDVAVAAAEAYLLCVHCPNRSTPFADKEAVKSHSLNSHKGYNVECKDAHCSNMFPTVGEMLAHHDTEHSKKLRHKKQGRGKKGKKGNGKKN